MDPNFFFQEGSNSNFMSSQTAISPLHEILMPPRPKITDFLYMTTSLPPPPPASVEPCMQQTVMENPPTTFESPLYQFFPDLPQMPIKPPPSFMSLLQGNEISIRHAELDLDPNDPRHFDPYPDLTTAPLFPVPSRPIPIYTTESMSYPPREVTPPPYIPNLLETSFGCSESQASNNVNQYNFNIEVMSPGLSSVHPMGSPAQDSSNDDADAKPMYICSICHVPFPTAQAYGGHMSSHSKAKKVRVSWRRPLKSNTVNEMLKKPKFDLNEVVVNTEKVKGTDLLAPSTSAGNSLNAPIGSVVKELSEGKGGMMKEEPMEIGNTSNEAVALFGYDDDFEGFLEMNFPTKKT